MCGRATRGRGLEREPTRLRRSGARARAPPACQMLLSWAWILVVPPDRELVMAGHARRGVSAARVSCQMPGCWAFVNDTLPPAHEGRKWRGIPLYHLPRAHRERICQQAATACPSGERMTGRSRRSPRPVPGGRWLRVPGGGGGCPVVQPGRRVVAAGGGCRWWWPVVGGRVAGGGCGWRVPGGGCPVAGAPWRGKVGGWWLRVAGAERARAASAPPLAVTPQAAAGTRSQPPQIPIGCQTVFISR